MMMITINNLPQVYDIRYSNLIQISCTKLYYIQQLYGHQPLITKTIQVRHAGHCWRCKDQLKSDILLWTPSHGRAKAGRPASTYIQQLCADTGYRLEDLPGTMVDRVGGERRTGRSVRYDDDSSTSNNLHTIVWFQVFLSIKNNLHPLVWYEVFLFNANNLYGFKYSYIILIVFNWFI